MELQPLYMEEYTNFWAFGTGLVPITAGIFIFNKKS